jgi:hypothetical protein
MDKQKFKKVELDFIAAAAGKVVVDYLADIATHEFGE